MRVLVVGNGGREHALLWKLRADAPDAELFVTRANGGMGTLAESVDVPPDHVSALVDVARARAVDLIVVGPEAPLADGLVDAAAARGIPAFGPVAAAARIEASKAFAKDLMTRARVPTAAYGVFDDAEAAERFIRERGAPIVVKASGLAAGKGAVVCDTVDEAIDAARAMLAGGRFGAAGERVIIEEFMSGEELSLFALCDGERALTMLPAQDHKRVGEGDTGPNTGGMGAYAPVSTGTPELVERVRREVFEPTLAALAEDGAPYRGLLYAGLMLTTDGLKVVEFNARLGDPETQVVLPLLRSSLLEPMLEIARGGSLAGASLAWRDGAALTTVLASEGYPGDYETGVPITIPAALEESDRVHVFHAGTHREGNRLLTAGGRVLAVTGLGSTLALAAARSREAAEAIDFPGKHFRHDIGWRELDRV
ncbi:MAG TPA: phosphoribosylamine--glycine ligase [Longimicrobiales bacterium]|nr:phosphoribosylamine--glycine ligase [Longimicrobiales bacterium]